MIIVYKKREKKKRLISSEMNFIRYESLIRVLNNGGEGVIIVKKYYDLFFFGCFDYIIKYF